MQLPELLTRSLRGAHREIKFLNQGRASILKGVDVLTNAVSVTRGPRGNLLMWPRYAGRSLSVKGNNVVDNYMYYLDTQGVLVNYMSNVQYE